MSVLRPAPGYDDGLEAVIPSMLEPSHPLTLEAVHPSTLEPAGKTDADYQPSFRPDTVETTRARSKFTSTTSILVIALIVVVVAAAVGGGVGGSIAVQNAKRSCTANATVASTPVFAVQTNVMLPLDCPGLDHDPQMSTFAHRTSRFQMHCQKLPNYERSASILSIIVYTLQDCLQACVSLNHYAGENKCAAASFYANLSHAIPDREANCFLRTKTGLTLNDTDTGSPLVTGVIDLT
ncbi:hypothetical protein F5Y14DRAFT_396092 [Nemania sp. NC0429]|nr:hypothetical protein F5Y14DRAFT_396092 [Nemania sp. NC0429]